VRLDQFFVDLPFQPVSQPIHHGAAFRLVILQPLFRRHAFFACGRVVAVDGLNRFQHVAALVGKAVVHVDELASCMSQAVRQDGLQFARPIARQRIAHLDRRRQFRRATLKHVFKIFARMFRAAKKQCNPAPGAVGDDAGGEQACALRFLLLRSFVERCVQGLLMRLALFIRQRLSLVDRRFGAVAG
jgi:hypothetical protein